MKAFLKIIVPVFSLKTFAMLQTKGKLQTQVQRQTKGNERT